MSCIKIILLLLCCTHLVTVVLSLACYEAYKKAEDMRNVENMSYRFPNISSAH